MTLLEYFKLPDTPMPGSSVGKLMQRIAEEDALELTTRAQFDDIRRQALECLASASGRKTYRVFTPAQEETQKASARKRFKKI